MPSYDDFVLKQRQQASKQTNKQARTTLSTDQMFTLEYEFLPLSLFLQTPYGSKFELKNRGLYGREEMLREGIFMAKSSGERTVEAFVQICGPH